MMHAQILGMTAIAETPINRFLEGTLTAALDRRGMDSAFVFFDLLPSSW
jgi:hypothetical protein